MKTKSATKTTTRKPAKSAKPVKAAPKATSKAASKNNGAQAVTHIQPAADTPATPNVGEPTPARVPSPTQFVAIALNEVIVDYAANCRQRKEDPTEWAAFVASIREQGVLQAPVVQYRTTAGGKRHAHLVAGFRRVTALREIHGTDCELVFPFTLIEGGEREARIVNGIENMARTDLAPYEKALLMSNLKQRDGMSAIQIAQVFSITDGMVNHYIRLRENLHPTLWKKMVAAGKGAKVALFIKMVSKPREEQIAAFENELAALEATKASKQAERAQAKADAARAKLTGADGTVSTPAGDGTESVPAGDGTESLSPAMVLPDEAVDDSIPATEPNMRMALKDASEDDDGMNYHAGVRAALEWVLGEAGYPFDVSVEVEE